jgi:nucleotide-binding universal stress UspA family protein
VKAQSALESVGASLGPKIKAACSVVVGDPADEIAALAAKERTGLVVMTLRGEGGLLGSRPGSIAYRVASHAVTPVLALPALGRRKRSVVMRSRSAAP